MSNYYFLDYLTKVEEFYGDGIDPPILFMHMVFVINGKELIKSFAGENISGIFKAVYFWEGAPADPAFIEALNKEEET